MLIVRGARVRSASLEDSSRGHPSAEFLWLDSRSLENRTQACACMQFVYNLLRVKGTPSVNTFRPASFFVPMILFNTNLMDAAH